MVLGLALGERLGKRDLAPEDPPGERPRDRERPPAPLSAEALQVRDLPGGDPDRGLAADQRTRAARDRAGGRRVAGSAMSARGGAPFVHQLDGATAKRVRAAAGFGGVPLYAVLFPFEQGATAALPGRWTLVGTVEDVIILRFEP